MSGIDYGSTTMKIFYACIALLSLKTLAMALLTARMRKRKGVLASPEDKSLMKNGKMIIDKDVERVRRAHRNDLENIPLFITAGFFYTLTNPCPMTAGLLFIAYTLSRFAHTYVYAIKVLPQPTRFLCFAVGYGITLYMAGSVIRFTGIV